MTEEIVQLPFHLNKHCCFSVATSHFSLSSLSNTENNFSFFVLSFILTISDYDVITQELFWAQIVLPPHISRALIPGWCYDVQYSIIANSDSDSRENLFVLQRLLFWITRILLNWAVVNKRVFFVISDGVFCWAQYFTNIILVSVFR